MAHKLWQAGGRDIPEAELSRIARRGRALARVLRIFGSTWRLREENWDQSQALRESTARGSFIFAFPHNRLGMLAYSHRDRSLQILNSSSRDGLLMSSMCEALGMDSVLGSSSRGAASALRDLARRGTKGLDLALTVDGPRGPRGRVKPGIVALAALTGSPVIPVSAAAAPRKVLSTWDQTVLPFPFSKVLVRFGEPLWLDRKADEARREEFRLEIEAALQTLSDEVDRALGVSVIAPAQEDHG